MIAPLSSLTLTGILYYQGETDATSTDSRYDDLMICLIHRWRETFQDPELPFPLYGHQGLAYGAVHGLFFREETPPEGICGFAFLSSAVSEQRSGVITAVNRDIARALWKA